MKRSPMKPRKAPMKRTGRLKPVSDKAKARQPDEFKWREECRERAGHKCELAGMFGIECTPGLQVDHVDGRKRAYDGNPEALMCTCPAHHEYKTLNKKKVHAVINVVWPGRIDRLKAIDKAYKAVQV